MATPQRFLQPGTRTGRLYTIMIMRMKSLFILFLLAFMLAACAVPELPAFPAPSVAPTVIPATATAVRETATPAPPTQTPVPPTATPIPPTATATPIPPTATPAPLTALDAETRAGWENYVEQVRGMSAPEQQTSVDELWQTLTAENRVPLMLEDAAIMLYKGQADTVTWRGDFSYWEFGTGLEAARVGDTDLWYAVADFPRESRTEYKIVLNGREWLLDPQNPHIQNSGQSDNSVLTMPEFQVTDFSEPRADVPHGTLTDWLTFESKAWGSPLRYRVYTPPNVEELENLPVFYVTDGNNFSGEQIGGMQNVLDNLIVDEKIRPAMAVFIDARNANDLQDNQRELQFLARPEAFGDFITTELVPLIDAEYPTDKSRAGRVLMGVSYGGVFTTFEGLRRPEVFGRLAIFSPAYWVLGNPAGVGGGDLTAGVRRMAQAIEKAMPQPAVENGQLIFMSGGLPNWDVGDLNPMANRFRARGDEIQVFSTQEGHSWSAWSGLTDEMLEYFFGN